MKTVIDLEKMKNQPCPPFENAYVYLISRLENDYISKSNGTDRIKQELLNWDNEARTLIILNLIATLNRELPGFDPSNLFNLL